MNETPKHASGKTDFELVEAAIDVAVNGADLHEDDEECPQDDTCECRDAAIVNDGHRALVRMDREIASLSEQARALLADNAALAQQLAAYHNTPHDPTNPHKVGNRTREMLSQPHPGAALLSEMEALRKQVWGLQKDVETERKALEQVSAERYSLREQVRALTAERDAFIASLEREARVADALRARVAELEAALSLQEDARFKLHDEAQALRAERDAAQQRAKALEEAVKDGGLIYLPCIRETLGLAKNKMATRDDFTSAFNALKAYERALLAAQYGTKEEAP